MDNSELHSFDFCEKVDGIEHSYRVTEKDGQYAIEKDGELIAAIKCDDGWQQTAGEHLDQALLQKIGDKIEDHYE